MVQPKDVYDNPWKNSSLSKLVMTGPWHILNRKTFQVLLLFWLIDLSSGMSQERGWFKIRKLHTYTPILKGGETFPFPTKNIKTIVVL